MENDGQGTGWTLPITPTHTDSNAINDAIMLGGTEIGSLMHSTATCR